MLRTRAVNSRWRSMPNVAPALKGHSKTLAQVIRLCFGRATMRGVAKKAAERTRPRIGDVIEIETPKGLAYAHYTHRHQDPPRYGALLRVLPGLHARRPSDFAPIVEQDDRFCVFFPLGAAANRGLVRIVANAVIPDAKQAFPVFRSRVIVGDQVGPWKIWAGTTERSARRGDRWTRHAVRQVWNDALLIDRIASGWSPDDDPRLSSD